MEQDARNVEQGFRRLKAWQRADELACAVFQALSLVPARHRWLAEQIGKAAVSVPANIAEGYGRGALKDYLRFLDIARGSLSEVEYYLHFLRKNDIIDGGRLTPVDMLRAETGSLLFGLTQSLRDKLREGGPWQRGLIREDAEEYLLATEE